MTEPAMSFDAEAMSSKLEELTETLCHLDYAARDATTENDPLKLAEVSTLVSGNIFGLPLMALPTVMMFIVGQLNHARNDAANQLVDAGAYAERITDTASRLAAVDVDAAMVLELLDVAAELRAASDASPYTPIEEDQL